MKLSHTPEDTAFGTGAQPPVLKAGSSGGWRQHKCSCPYKKNFTYKHLVAISTRVRVYNHIMAKQVPLSQKRKRGAPSNAKKA